MKQHFFIIGFPRSRTSWLANLLTFERTFCFHDGLKHLLTSPTRGAPDLLRGLFDTLPPGIRNIGDADSALALYGRVLVPAFPAARWVWVRRDLAVALDSYLEHFSERPYPGTERLSVMDFRTSFERIEAGCERVRELVPGERFMEIDFMDLEEYEPCLRLADFCGEPAAASRPRWEMLNTFRVNIIAEKIAAQIEERRELHHARD